MIVGTIAYQTQSGLGLLAKRFYDHGIVQRILPLPHTRYKQFPEWYKPGDTYRGIDWMNQFLDGMQTLLLFENAFDRWDVVKLARQREVKIVLMPMYEWTPLNLPVKPDLVLCPSLLDLDIYEREGYKCKYLPVPTEVVYRERSVVETFVHNMGHGGYDYRNGTPELLEAMKYVKSPLGLVIRGQYDEPRVEKLLEPFFHARDPRLTIEVGNISEKHLWYRGEAFVYPEKFNGLSLPLQEAFCSGMLVVATDHYPANSYLPCAPLIPTNGFDSRMMPNGRNIQVSKIDPTAIAATMDKWYGTDVSEYSKIGKTWAQQASWKVLKPEYLKVLS